jgi:hypothetical protein
MNVFSKLNELLKDWERLSEEIKYYTMQTKRCKGLYQEILQEKRKELKTLKQKYRYYKTKADIK